MVLRVKRLSTSSCRLARIHPLGRQEITSLTTCTPLLALAIRRTVTNSLSLRSISSNSLSAAGHDISGIQGRRHFASGLSNIRTGLSSLDGARKVARSGSLMGGRGGEGIWTTSGISRGFTTSVEASSTLTEVSKETESLGAPPPLNEVQVPLISPHLRSQLFPPPSSPYSPPPPPREVIQISLDHLKSHGLLAPSKKPTKVPEPAIDFVLPLLQGPTISHHFHAIGNHTAAPYLSLAKSLAAPTTVLPPKPTKHDWVLQPGWTFYSPDGSHESVRWPREKEEALVFDIETLPFRGGHYPVMAIAAGTEGWYAWFSPWVTGDDKDPNHLIPFSEPPSTEIEPLPDSSAEPSLFERKEAKPRLLVGHNVLFDRARVASEYTLRRPTTRWIDTLSLHVSVSGLTNPQRPSWAQYRKDQKKAELEALNPVTVAPIEGDDESPIASTSTSTSKAKAKTATVPVPPPGTAKKSWQDLSSPNSLVEVALLHLGKELDKSMRNVFIDPTTTLEDLRDHFSELIAYCAEDVQTTFEVYQTLLPKFLATCPHPASFAGILLMSQPILPVNYKWPQYLERANKVYEERSEAVKSKLVILAEEARAKFEKVGESGKFLWEEDVWLRQLDWTPKKARRLPGVAPVKRKEAPEIEVPISTTLSVGTKMVPTWLAGLDSSKDGQLIVPLQSPLAVRLFNTTWKSFPVVYTHSHGWLFAVPSTSTRQKYKPEAKEVLVPKTELGVKDALVSSMKGVRLYTIPHSGVGKCRLLLGKNAVKMIKDGLLASAHKSMMLKAVEVGKTEEGKDYEQVQKKLGALTKAALKLTKERWKGDLWLSQLDWTPISPLPRLVTPVSTPAMITASSSPATASSDLVWPKWYKDLDLIGQGLDISIGKRAAPLLLKLRWKGFPIVYSVEYGWIYRVVSAKVPELLAKDVLLKPLEMSGLTSDMDLLDDKDAVYFKLPHPDGAEKNVGSPLSKAFVDAFEEGILTSEYPVAAEALALNASCSYWTSSKDRITNQMVVWEGDAKIPAPTPEVITSSPEQKTTRGLILPQVVPMGTVTRRAVEKTWLTASNAKKNRVGSELKSMVQAPPGYAIVGADVDSEELWICSVMGDAQFGIHGATAIGWMTLEGTKSAGTDLHSKSASILGISRDDAKVFNYSRIYGAGVKHAVQLLLKSNPNLAPLPAKELAQALYAGTKGLVDKSPSFARSFWHGGTESFVFNKLEQIAMSDNPKTPALGCGITDALKKAHLPAEGRSKIGEGFMPSRINWVVQSSGVDYLHMLLVSMEYLTKRYNIDARYMISVHDEVRYLVKEEDRFRLAMALQISNLWTRALFSYRLQMGDLPQSCAFFSAVDIDHCFRKEVNMTCLTPSNPDSIPFGTSFDISDSLKSTSNGSLFADGRSMEHDHELGAIPYPADLSLPQVQGEQHRAPDTPFLIAQTKASAKEVRELWNSVKDGGKASAAKSAMKPSRVSSVAASAAKSRTWIPPTRSTVKSRSMDNHISRVVGEQPNWAEMMSAKDEVPKPRVFLRPSATLKKPEVEDSKNVPKTKYVKPVRVKSTNAQLEEDWDIDIPEDISDEYFTETAAATRRASV